MHGTGTAAFDATNYSFTEIGGAGTFAVDDLIKARRILEAAENEEDDDMHSWHIVMSARSSSSGPRPDLRRRQ